MARIAVERPARPPLKRIEPPPELRGLRLGHYGIGKTSAILRQSAKTPKPLVADTPTDGNRRRGEVFE
jgi:hypothetical protein